MTQYEAILNFVTEDLCEGNTRSLARASVEDIFDTVFKPECDVRITFNEKHRDLYKRVLAYCIEHDLTVISTQPATLATVVRVSTDF